MTDPTDEAPDLLRDIVRDLDVDSARRLVDAFGGRKIYIPNKGAKSELRQILGTTLLDYLSERKSGEWLQVPNNSKTRMAMRRRREVLQHSNLSANDLAQRLGITARHVERIRESLRDGDGGDPKQLSLFD